MRTLEQVKKLWEWFVCKFCHVLSADAVLYGGNYIKAIEQSCQIVRGAFETPLSEEAKDWLRRLNECLTEENEFFEGYFALEA